MPYLSLEHDQASARPSLSAAFLFPALLCAVALIPLPLGGNRPWAWETLGVVVGCLMTGVGIDYLRHPAQPRTSIAPLKLAAFFFMIAVAWATIQCLPFTPNAWHHPLWSQAIDYFGPQLSASVSINRVGSISHVFRLITYAGIFWLSYSFCHDVGRARTVVKAATAIVTAYAVWGLIVYWDGNTTILWFQKWAYLTDLTGTFVNRNSFATFLGLGLLTGVALLFEGVRRRVDFRESSRGIIKAALELVIVRLRWLTLASLAIATALFLTHSRGGAISTLLALIAFLMAVNFAPSLSARWHIMFGAVLIASLSAMLVISDNVMTGRLAESSFETEGRPRIFEQTLEAMRDWPIFGTGLGTFRDVFPLYRTEDMPLTVAQAHNDYLETIVELGWPAAISLFLSMTCVLGICVRGLRLRRRDAVLPCVGIGATALVAIHSLFDFSLQMPGVAAVYWLLMGAATAQSFNSPQSTE